MKKALLLALVGLFAAVAPALAYPPPAANVNFVSERGVPFDLALDGRLVTRGGARQVHVDRLMPGQHWADFTVPAGYGRVVRFRSRVWLQPGLETSYVLIARPGRPLDLRQISAVALYGPGYGGGNGYYNGPGYDNRPYNSPAPYPGPGGYNGYPYNGGNAAPNGYPNNGGYDNGGYNNNPNGIGGYNNHPNNGNGNGGYYPGSATSSLRTLSSPDAQSLAQSMKQRPFDSNRVSMAKDALAQSNLTADDLERLLRSLDFDSSRADLAKYAYSHVVDPQNFERVYDAFQSEATVREVQQALEAAPQR